MASALWLCAFILAFVGAWWIFEYGTARRRRMRSLAASMPGPPAWPIVGNAFLFMAKPDELLSTMMGYLDQYGDCCKFWLGSELMVCVNNAADIRHLLTSNKINLKGPLYGYMKRFIGPGVLSEGGPIWRSHRKLATPAFSKRTVSRYAGVVNDSADSLIAALGSRDQRQTFDVYHDVVQATTSIVCQCIIGLTKEEVKNVKSMDTIIKRTQAMYDLIFTYMTHWWCQVPLIYWLSGRKAEELYYLKIIDEITSDIVAKRRAALKNSIPEELSLIDTFILCGQMTEQDIKWETMTFFTASQEASAKIASMVLLILAHLPDWQDKVYKEIIEVLGAEDGYILDEQVRRLKALDVVYKEAIRLMPIGAFIQRTVEEEVTISGGITLPKGASVLIPIYAVQRDCRYWQDPHRVDPGRFLPENASKRDPDAYIPYSLGGMDCIGRIFAESLIKIIVARVLRRLQLEADGRIEDLDLNVAISVKMAKGYNLRVKPRT